MDLQMERDTLREKMLVLERTRVPPTYVPAEPAPVDPININLGVCVYIYFCHQVDDICNQTHTSYLNTIEKSNSDVRECFGRC